MEEIIIKREGITLCVCKNKSCLYPEEILHDMKKNGYKFYKDGKIYKI